MILLAASQNILITVSQGIFKTPVSIMMYFMVLPTRTRQHLDRDKLRGFKTVNSSICEQFNSFIKNVKTSSKLMSQCHFSFYLQFFINVWNTQKYETFSRKKNIAICGEM